MSIKFLHTRKPLIHCITNPISVNQCANLILALGCRPIMAEHPEEVSEITSTAAALLLNIGNITDARMESIAISAKVAQEHKIPFVFDAVGIACSSLRRKFTYNFLKEFTPTVLKGNYSEINALYDSSYTSSGVDSDFSLKIPKMLQITAELSARLGCIIVASGKTDIIADLNKSVCIHNGCSQLASVTGTGCMLGAAIACFLTASNSIDSVSNACAFLGICGEKSSVIHKSGSFMTQLMDNLSAMNDDDIAHNIKTEVKNIEKF